MTRKAEDVTTIPGTSEAFQAAREKMAAAQRELADAEQAERDYRERLREAQIQAGKDYRNDTHKAGGYLRHVNRAAEVFTQAVRDGDGAAVVTAWIAWRREAAKTRAVSDAFGSWASRERPGQLPGGYGAPDVPDLTTALLSALAPIEREDQAATAREIQEDHAARTEKLLARLAGADQ